MKRSRQMRCLRPILVILPTILMSGCHIMAPAQNKDVAQMQWNKVRGRIKCQLARQHARAGRFDDTVIAATEALALDPTLVEGYELLAGAHLELGRPASAMQAVGSAEQAGVASPELDYLTGVILEQQGETERAFERYRRARRVAPDQVDYLVAEAECLVVLGRAEEAMALLEGHAVQMDERATLAALSGHVAAALGEEEKAIDSYGRSLVVNPNNHVVRRELGLLLAERERCTEAVGVLTPLVEEGVPAANGRSEGDTEWPFPGARRALAACHVSLGANGRAVSMLAEYAETAQADVEAQLLLGRAALSVGNVTTAARAAHRAWQHAPQDPNVMFLRAAVFWRYGRFADAESLVTGLLENRPDDGPALCLLGRIQHDLGRYADARASFRRADAADDGRCSGG